MSVIKLNPTELLAHFDQHAFACSHSLIENPLFSNSSLRHLAEQLTPQHFEYETQVLPVNSPVTSTAFKQANRTELLKSFDNLTHSPSWIVLKNVEQEPKYRDLLETILNLANKQGLLEIQDSFQHEAFIFISSAQYVTPYHMDPEHNFLLHLQGKKKIWVLGKENIPDLEIENFYKTGQRQRPMPTDALEKAQLFTLEPGDALYIPPTTPHWVEVLPGEQSLSFSVTFRTSVTRNREKNYRANAFLRSLGWTPHPVGSTTQLKLLKYMTWVLLRRWMKGT